MKAERLRLLLHMCGMRVRGACTCERKRDLYADDDDAFCAITASHSRGRFTVEAVSASFAARGRALSALPLAETAGGAALGDEAGLQQAGMTV